MKWLSPCTKMPTIATSCGKARIANRIAYREVVDHLPLLRRQVEITVHFVVVESANACRAQPERFGGEIQAVADRAGFEMHIAVTTIAMGAAGAIEIADHRERCAGVA